MVPSLGESTEVLERISRQLETLVRLTAASQIDGLNQTETVQRLGSLGFSAKEISEISGHPITSVAPTLSRLKRSAEKT